MSWPIRSIDFEHQNGAGWTIPYSLIMSIYDNNGTYDNTELEDTFIRLCDQIKSLKGEKYLKQILEIKTNAGTSCLSLASLASNNIFTYLLKLNLRVDSVKSDGTGISFQYANDEETAKLLQNGANPYVRDFKYNQCEYIDRSTKFTNQMAKLSKFEKVLHFSTEPSKCNHNCPRDCTDKLPAYTLKNGEKVTIGSVIGTGGFGAVTRGQLHGQSVAVKRVELADTIYIPDYAADTLQAATGMSKEALDMKSMQHPNILLVLDFWIQQTDDKRYFCLAMELMEHSLSQYMLKYPKFNPNVMRTIAREVCSALMYIASKDMAHLDVKPENILISMNSGRFSASKLGDFGLVDRAGGTPMFCSPEQLFEARITKSDVFGFGVTLLKMIAKNEISNILLSLPLSRAIAKPAISKKLPKLPMLETISKMLQVDPDMRPDFKDVDLVLQNKFPQKEINKTELQVHIPEINNNLFYVPVVTVDAHSHSQHQW